MTQNDRTPGRYEVAVGSGIIGISVADWVVGVSPKASVVYGLLFIGLGLWRGRP